MGLEGALGEALVTRGFVPCGARDGRQPWGGGCVAERGGSVRRPGKDGNESTCGCVFCQNAQRNTRCTPSQSSSVQLLGARVTPLSRAPRHTCRPRAPHQPQQPISPQVPRDRSANGSHARGSARASLLGEPAVHTASLRAITLVFSSPLRPRSSKSSFTSRLRTHGTTRSISRRQRRMPALSPQAQLLEVCLSGWPEWLAVCLREWLART